MSKFVIAPHMRLHEWIAVEKGYFDEVGLEYELEDQLKPLGRDRHDLGDKVGAYQTFEKGRSCDVSSACHWTVNVAAASGHGKLYAKCYSVSPCAIFVPADSAIKRPEDLAGVPISVGYQSGSHYSTIQAMERFLPADQINLSFADGLLFKRMEHMIDGNIPAVSLFSGPYYFMEQMGFRKVLDTSFMMAAMVAEDANMGDVEKFFAALRRAQSDIDLRQELYTHYYRNEFPERFQAQMDTRLFGPGERVVFEPYSREIFDASREWIAARDIFEGGDLGSLGYDEAVVAPAV
ncbi:hypothetical protein AIOL_003211 [Candidatus Rhodobacter oscarellae]|uniref:ABC transporter substrate-binding protein n=1 Tax=Candidatus Rhodobacter oscarellae TaxID=1675527 RepID=A0A0J9E647_9RHOB|nr:hypothetical protein [Candidatus Rhodobacter lobularis]KMW58240.1 hypothetical protein AIOL_003211 [Candidatus Rhodobacter lobularis]